MATLVRNVSGSNYPLPATYGGVVLRAGGSAIIEDTRANVLAALGDPSPGVFQMSTVPDGQEGAITPVSPSAGVAYTPASPSKWSSAPTTVAGALDNVASAGGAGASTLAGDLAGSTLASPVVASGAITSAKMASGAAAFNVGSLSGDLSGTLPGPSVAAASRPLVGASRQVRAVVASALPTYGNVSGVLTATSNGAIGAQDGVTLAVNDRVLLAAGAAGADNGVYVVTSLGSGSTPWVLTRAADFAQGAVVSGMRFFVSIDGTAWGGSEWFLATGGSVTVGSTSLSFYPLSARGTTAAMTAGMITVSGTWLRTGAKVLLTTNTIGGTAGTLSAPSASRTAGAGSGSFVITSSSNLDTSTVDYSVVNA